MIDRWYDAKDEEGVWRIGECFFEDKEGTKTIAFDGFHPNFTTVINLLINRYFVSTPIKFCQYAPKHMD